MAGVVTLSIELELGWGMHDESEYGHLSPDRSAERTALYRLLNLADRYAIPITFDIVGHLLHDSCAGTHDGPLPDSWWSEDPGTNADTDPLFYAPDLVSEIQNRPIEHELTTHTYSHLLADEFSAVELDDELSKVAKAHSQFGIPAPSSIVMPRHQDPDYSVLADHGIEVIRRPIEGYSESFSNSLSKFWWLLTRSHPESSIRIREGILETLVTPHPSLTAVSLSAGQSTVHPAFSAIPRTMRKYIQQRYLRESVERARRKGEHIHLWTHLYNFANDPQWKAMKPGLTHIGELYSNNEIRVATMQQLPEIVQ